VNNLLALVARAGHDHRIRCAGPAVVGQVQIGVEAVSVAEEGKRSGGHEILLMLVMLCVGGWR